MDSTRSKSKRVKVEPDQPHHIHLVEEDTDNEDNVVNNDCQTGQHMHHHHHFHYHHHHYHHHGNNEPTPPPPPPPPPINVPVRIHLKIESANKFLAVINCKLALVSSNTDDNRQYWEIRRDKIIKDETGQPAFALVNKSTGQAMRGSHACYGVNALPGYRAAYGHMFTIKPWPVDLVAYHPEGAIGAVYGSQLWVHGVDKPGFGDYKFLSPHENSRFNLDGSCPTKIVTTPSIGGVYQRWKFLAD